MGMKEWVGMEGGVGRGVGVEASVGEPDHERRLDLWGLGGGVGCVRLLDLGPEVDVDGEGEYGGLGSGLGVGSGLGLGTLGLRLLSTERESMAGCEVRTRPIEAMPIERR